MRPVRYFAMLATAAAVCGSSRARHEDPTGPTVDLVALDGEIVTMSHDRPAAAHSAAMDGRLAAACDVAAGASLSRNAAVAKKARERNAAAPNTPVLVPFPSGISDLNRACAEDMGLAPTSPVTPAWPSVARVTGSQNHESDGSSAQGHTHEVVGDGAWCWFADPRAIWDGQDILAGAVTQSGDITATFYNPKSATQDTIVLAKDFEKDDHDNPAFLSLPDGRLAAFYSKHSGPDLFMATTVSAANHRAWTTPVTINLNDAAYQGPVGAINLYTYPNPQLLAEERNRIYLFWRGMNWKPTFSYSDDLGATWSTGQILVTSPGDNPRSRPYVKVAGDGRSRIHIAFTDGHPRNEPTNSIYYMRYEHGAFRNASGEEIADVRHVPIQPEQADVVYDGKSEGVRAWIWDVAQDAKGNPVITYSRLPSEGAHFYRYAHWNGRRWVDRPITPGGKWFPQTPEGTREPEPHYSGGVVLDHHDPRFVYVSRPVGERFEIERWFSSDGGDTWSHVALTSNSDSDNVRPVVIRGDRPEGSGPNALWMNSLRYRHYTDFAGTIQAADEHLGPFSANDPMQAADAVFKWVLSNPSHRAKNHWAMAPLYSGVLAYAQHRQNAQAVDWVRREGRAIGYAMGPRNGMADDVAVGHAFLRLYQLDKDDAQLNPVKRWIDGFVAMSHDRSLEWKDNVQNSELAWCDALYMAPPAMALLSTITGDQTYADTMSILWWKTSDYLFDAEEGLYFRDSRYFAKREANGEKVFWSRGNGWVMAGLANVLEYLPDQHPDRTRFVAQFRAISKRLAELQTADGTWHASLLDPKSFPAPETSGTGFIVYALAWGVNHEVLDRKSYMPTIERGFAALCRAVDPNGRVSWVQAEAADPFAVKESDTDTYGVGAFLLAACEFDKLAK